ncbi:MAG TPA: SsrA-binding protein SmpB [Polyangiaceae bacterium]|nr:SsrA-binding protein SmpB [Polyangiaceae bacterium]
MSKGESKADKKGAALTGDRVLATNRRASHDYELGTRFEAGLALIGSEARSLRETAPGLADSWVDIDKSGEAWVMGLRIAPLKHAAFGHGEVRPRKLLLHRVEIDKLRMALEREGMTLIPTKIYFKAGRAKLEISVARGKKHYDKRASIKARDADREAAQAMQRGRKDY